MVETLTLTPTMWSHFPDVDEVKPIGDQDYAVLAEIRGVLAKHNALNRFGISLIHRHFDLKDGEIIFESTNSEDREQFVNVRCATEIQDGQNVLQTQWVFDDSRENVICVGYCHYASGHKHYHSKK